MITGDRSVEQHVLCPFHISRQARLSCTGLALTMMSSASEDLPNDGRTEFLSNLFSQRLINSSDTTETDGFSNIAVLGHLIISARILHRLR